ncbi:Importin subunit alpha-2 [Platanthera guangdongensis]|uniref:Importin subunit alpha-2 n=1 Tax=Platanthera guangdongensis TaxID=2320717 RepID=A0ABR2MBJ2_9ASPA
MADEVSSPASQHRDGIKFSARLSANNIAAQRRRKNAISLGKERREVLIRTKRMCREGPADYNGTSLEIDMVVDEEKAILDSQASKVVEDLKSALRLHYIFDVNDILVKSTMVLPACYAKSFPDALCHSSSLYRRHLRPWAIPVTTSRTAAVLVNETRTFLPLFFRCLQRQEA